MGPPCPPSPVNPLRHLIRSWWRLTQKRTRQNFVQNLSNVIDGKQNSYRETVPALVTHQILRIMKKIMYLSLIIQVHLSPILYYCLLHCSIIVSFVKRNIVCTFNFSAFIINWVYWGKRRDEFLWKATHTQKRRGKCLLCYCSSFIVLLFQQQFYILFSSLSNTHTDTHHPSSSHTYKCMRWIVEKKTRRKE